MNAVALSTSAFSTGSMGGDVHALIFPARDCLLIDRDNENPPQVYTRPHLIALNFT